MPLSGVLAEYGFAGGWPSIFYVFGLVGTIWSILFLFVVYEDPNTHPSITEQEKKYINLSVWGTEGMSVSVNYKHHRLFDHILLIMCDKLSKPFWIDRVIFLRTSDFGKVAIRPRYFSGLRVQMTD